MKKIMFPNYCFQKRADEFGYEVMYVPKDRCRESAQQFHHYSDPNTRSRARQQQQQQQQQQHSKQGYDDEYLPLQALQQRTNQMRLPQGQKSQSQSHATKPARSVEFRLPPVEQQRHMDSLLSLRENAGLSPAERDFRKKQQQQQTPPNQSQQHHAQQQHAQHQHAQHQIQHQIQHHAQQHHAQQHQTQQQQTQQQQPPRPTSNSSDRELHATYADFFNIIYDNVLEAVNGTVGKLISKYFQAVISKVDQVTDSLSLQETLLRQMNGDLARKMSQHNEASINQFKIISEMLIDSQANHYCSLIDEHNRNSQNSQNSQERKNEHGENKSSGSLNHVHHLAEGCGQRRDSNCTINKEEQQELQRRPQHQLWQQQDFRQQVSPYRNTNTQKSYRSRLTSLRRSPKGASTASMPNLSLATISSSSNTCNKKKQHQLASMSAGWNGFTNANAVHRLQAQTISSYQKCRCNRSPAPPQRNNHMHPNKFRSSSRALDDERTHG